MDEKVKEKLNKFLWHWHIKTIGLITKLGVGEFDNFASSEFLKDLAKEGIFLIPLPELGGLVKEWEDYKIMLGEYGDKSRKQLDTCIEELQKLIDKYGGKK